MNSMSDGDVREVTVQADQRARLVEVRVTDGEVDRTVDLDPDVSVDYLADGTVAGFRVRSARFAGELLPGTHRSRRPRGDAAGDWPHYSAEI